MIWLAVATVLLAVAFDGLTLMLVRRQPRPRPWALIAWLFLLVGVAVGGWCGFLYRYQWSEGVELLGFPIPILVFKLEDGHWVDYVGNPLLGFVSVSLVASAFLLPVTLGLLVAGLWRQWHGETRISARR
jgi:hypothetical protein